MVVAIYFCKLIQIFYLTLFTNLLNNTIFDRQYLFPIDVI